MSIGVVKSMRCLKYLSPIIMLAFNLAYWLGFHNECVCKDCKSCFDYKDVLFDHRRERCPFCGSENWEKQD